MRTTPDDIREWLDRVKDNDEYAYMLVLCDTYSYEDFPSYVSKNDNIHETINIYDNRDYIRVMECYNLKMDLESQISEKRTWNL